MKVEGRWTRGFFVSRLRLFSFRRGPELHGGGATMAGVKIVF